MILELIQLALGVAEGALAASGAREQPELRPRRPTEDARRRRMDRALARVNLVVLAALLDGVVTEAERSVLERACTDGLARIGIRTTTAEIIERWERELEPTGDRGALEARVRELRAALEPEDIQWVLSAVGRLAAADRRADGSYRDRTVPAPSVDDFRRWLRA